MVAQYYDKSNQCVVPINITVSLYVMTFFKN